jgi:fructokinase
LQHNGVNTDYLVMDHRCNTSIIFVSRTTGTPDFEPFRNADFNLTPEDIPAAAIRAAKVVHTLHLAAVQRTQPLGGGEGLSTGPGRGQNCLL